jgi:hypothetical protein
LLLLLLLLLSSMIVAGLAWHRTPTSKSSIIDPIIVMVVFRPHKNIALVAAFAAILSVYYDYYYYYLHAH